MSRFGQLVLASVFVAFVGFSSATTALGDTANFNFETSGTTSGGGLSSLTSVVGGLTMTLTRPGSSFDVIDLSVYSPSVPASFGIRTLSPFANSGNTLFNADFSSAISSLSIDMGDFVPSDLDTLTMVAYDALNGAGNIVGSATLTCCSTAVNGDFVFSTLTVSGVGIRSVRFIGGGPTSPNTVYYDNITATFTPAAIPEPATIMLLGTGLIGVAARFRRRRNSRS